VSDRPYSQRTQEGGVIIRTFSGVLDDVELKWHRDARDREVTFLSGEGWSLQLEGGLPRRATPGMSVLIPRDAWHRLLREGTGDLLVRIREM
jgi:quercetin dioxygenase-like cupin family protein